jgi:predicted metalloprotease with PDZ domain
MNSDFEHAAVVYQVCPSDPGAHIFTVTCRIEKPDPGGQVFSMPAWIPGSYLIRDYARHVIKVDATVDGLGVAVWKTEKSTWKTAAVDGPLLISAEIYANDLSVRGAFVDGAHAFFNGVCLLFEFHGLADSRCLLHLAPPPDQPVSNWKVATGLERVTGNDDEFGAFFAASYEGLIDHPVLMGRLSFGRFEVAQVEHVIAVTGHDNFDMARLERDVRKICSVHAQFFGDTVPMSRYVFLIVAFTQGYGGLEHRNSSALICNRNGLPRSGQSRVTSNYRDLLGLISHEYFHLWNVKRIRPAEFIPYVLSREAYTRQLWVFEGITSYYDDLGLLRGQLIARESYLELLGRTLTAVYRSRGRRRQTLEESSFDAWIKFYKADENAPNAIVSYYSKGAMVALALDLELRLKTEGRCSLDDVMRTLWQKYGAESSRGLAEGGLERVAEEVSGLNLGEFFKQSLRTTVDPPIGILLAQFGVCLNMRARESESDRGGSPGKREDHPGGWLGFGTRMHGDRVIIKHVFADGPAVKAGLSAGDEWIALDGYRVTAGNLKIIFDDIEIDQNVTLDVFRRDQLVRVQVLTATPPRNTCYLTVDSDSDEAAVLRRRQWLRGGLGLGLEPGLDK